MSKTINQRELRNETAKVMREIQAGQSVIVTRNGQPIAEVRPIQPRRFAPRATLTAAAARLPAIDAQRFRTDVDATVNQCVDD